MLGREPIIPNPFLKKARRIAVAAVFFFAALPWGMGYVAPPPACSAPARSGAREAFEARRSGVWLRAKGEVARLLPDDIEGSRHQRFILRLPGGQTLLISHNIDIAPRVPASVGDELEVSGRYEWNEKGGLIHWTHRDPAGRKAGGWIRRGGKTYR